MSKRIYLSPSNQNRNAYATGNTTEMAQCDKIANATASALKRCGFDVRVGKSGDTMENRCNESDRFGADIHMPIHTNAYNGKVTGGTRIFCLNSNGKKACDSVLRYLGSISPGTGDSVSYQSGLYEINVPRALTVYVECEFHDTKTGSDWIRANTQNIAEAICHGMCDYFGVRYVKNTSGVATSNEPKKKATVQKNTNKTSTKGSSSVKSVQMWCNSYKTGIAVDGVYGTQTKKALVKVLQTEMNRQYGSRLVVDGIYGNATNSAVRNLSKGCKGNITKALQGLLICNGFDTNGFDGIYGNGTVSAVKSYQKKKKLVADGIAGKATFSALCK